MNLNRIRLRAVWLPVVAFIALSRPTWTLLGVGAPISMLGLLLRGWAAGTIHKEVDLTTSGPYAHTRNPLYLGTFFIGVGVTLAGGQWIWPLLFLLFFATVYRRAMASEAVRLSELFGDRFHEYVSAVPAFVPRLTAYRASHPDAAAGFRLSQYVRNREWDALFGTTAAFGVLALKAWLG